jgi:hypothetical protein
LLAEVVVALMVLEAAALADSVLVRVLASLLVRPIQSRLAVVVRETVHLRETEQTGRILFLARLHLLVAVVEVVMMEVRARAGVPVEAVQLGRV